MFKEDFKEIISYFLVIDFVFYDEEGAEKHNNWFSDEQQNKVLYNKILYNKVICFKQKRLPTTIFQQQEII